MENAEEQQEPPLPFFHRLGNVPIEEVFIPIEIPICISIPRAKLFLTVSHDFLTVTSHVNNRAQLGLFPEEDGNQIHGIFLPYPPSLPAQLIVGTLGLHLYNHGCHYFNRESLPMITPPHNDMNYRVSQCPITLPLMITIYFNQPISETHISLCVDISDDCTLTIDGAYCMDTADVFSLFEFPA